MKKLKEARENERQQEQENSIKIIDLNYVLQNPGALISPPDNRGLKVHAFFPPETQLQAAFLTGVFRPPQTILELPDPGQASLI